LPPNRLIEHVADSNGYKPSSRGTRKMAEEAGSELVAVACEHLSKVKHALLSRSNMDKTRKEEAVQAVSEVDSLLNTIRGMFLRLECTLKKPSQRLRKKAHTSIVRF
jgi:hypothetical protein